MFLGGGTMHHINEGATVYSLLYDWDKFSHKTISDNY